jgi:hypothetical protein
MLNSLSTTPFRQDRRTIVNPHNGHATFRALIVLVPGRCIAARGLSPYKSLIGRIGSVL